MPKAAKAEAVKALKKRWNLLAAAGLRRTALAREDFLRERDTGFFLTVITTRRGGLPDSAWAALSIHPAL